MAESLPGMALALLGGALVAWVNYLLTRGAASRPGGAGMISVVRTLFNAAYLTAVFFVSPLTPWERIPMLAAAVAGLTVPMFFFTALLVRRMKGGEAGKTGASGENEENGEKGEDDNG